MSALSQDIWSLLRGVSRSMYLSFKVLPPEVRGVMGLGYLLCRAADTIADTRLIHKEERLRALERYREAFSSGAAVRLDVPAGLARHQASASERELLLRLEQCLELWRRCPEEESALLKDAVFGVTDGMRMDLTLFPGEDSSTLAALPSEDELDRYCFYIGGAPGLFWTRLCLLKVRSLAGVCAEQLEPLALRLGKGLQMTNILRDIATDLRIGRCYLPEDELRQAGLAPQDLLAPSFLPRLRPVLRRWLLWARRELDAGAGFVERMPGLRLRAAAAWPLLLAFKTLALVARSKDLLRAERGSVKVARRGVYGLLAGSLWTIPSNVRFRKALAGLRADLDAELAG
ncbi:MAG: squalene/phytoene synthase family protein [Elusimicrobia bacterium]|nr:squalene/phytoene synthase family protein [Elusimicrobiota bacterium]